MVRTGTECSVASISHNCIGNAEPLSAKCEALIIPGVDMYHGDKSNFGNPWDLEIWSNALQAKYDGVGKTLGRAEFYKLLGSYQGISDLPPILFSDNFIDSYPEAKISITHRDVNEWYTYLMLCKFLDVPEPAIPHPQGNSTETIAKRMRALHSVKMLEMTKRIGVADVSVVGSVSVTGRSRSDDHDSGIRGQPGPILARRAGHVETTSMQERCAKTQASVWCHASKLKA